MEQALKSMEQMMQQLVEDRRQREEEFASECATWQRAADNRIQEMQAQTCRQVDEASSRLQAVYGANTSKTPQGRTSS